MNIMARTDGVDMIDNLPRQGSAVLGLTVALTAAFSEFLTATVPVPMGVLLAFVALIILPTGELIELIAATVRNITPKKD